MSRDATTLEFTLGQPFGPTDVVIRPGDYGPPTDLTGASLTFVAREINGEADVLSVAMALSGTPTDGTATLLVPATGDAGERVADLTPGVVYRYKVRDGAGNVLIAGTLLVRAEWG